MALFNIAENNKPGFIVDSTDRAELLAKQGFNLPKARKTGTTICGVIYKDGVILGADTRATEDDTVSDKNCVKIHYMQDNIFCCGAGTAADTDMTTRMISSQLELHKYYTGRQVQINCAKHILKQLLYRYQGHISAALIIGGVDVDGPHLYSIYPHGSSDSLPFVTMGSGSLAAMAHFEKNFKVGMEEKEAKKLVRDAICGGIFNDLGSGSNVDLCIIRKGNTEFLRTYDEANEKGVRENRYVYPSGTSTVRKFKIEDIEVQETVEPIAPDDQMDTSS